MRRIHTLLTLWLTFLTVSAFGQVSPAPSLMNFQGRLTRSDGTPIANGNYSLRFSLWTAVTGGTEKWNQTLNPVAVRNGTFAVLLNVASPTDLFNTNLWLEIKIGTAAPLTPRQQLASVAFALKANTVPDNAITSAKIADGTITSADIANGTIGASDLASGVLDFWKLTGNAGTTSSHFLGTTDNKPLHFRANNRRVLRIEDRVDAGNTYHTVNILGGAPINNIDAGVIGATIAGGGQDNNTGLDGPNDIRGDFGTIGGGSANFIDTYTFGTIAGGAGNIIQGNYATVGGGASNNPAANYVTIGGGLGNYAFGVYAAIGGGFMNSIASEYGTIAGGRANSVTGVEGAVGGGFENTAQNYATVGGGRDNNAGPYGTIAGGYSNITQGLDTAIGGGITNIANGNRTTIGGGGSNVAAGESATIGGGNSNIANADYATIPGGYQNYAGGIAGFAAGHRAFAFHNGSFVWSDYSSTAHFEDTGSNQFLIRAAGGVGIGTNTPAAQLHVNGLNTTGGTAIFQSPKGGNFSHVHYGPNGDWYIRSAAGSGIVVLQDNDGRVGIGTATPGYKLHVNGSVAGVGNYNSLSDERYKTNVQTFPNALDAILNLRGVTFDWKRNDYPGMNFADGRQVGFIAQEVEKVLPEAVSMDSTGTRSVAYANVVPVLVEAMKQQQRQIQSRDARILRLEAQLAELAEAVRKLQANQK
jgi:hypothetical protein